MKTTTKVVVVAALLLVACHKDDTSFEHSIGRLAAAEAFCANHDGWISATSSPGITRIMCGDNTVIAVIINSEKPCNCDNNHFEFTPMPKATQ